MGLAVEDVQQSRPKQDNSWGARGHPIEVRLDDFVRVAHVHGTPAYFSRERVENESLPGGVGGAADHHDYLVRGSLLDKGDESKHDEVHGPYISFKLDAFPRG